MQMLILSVIVGWLHMLLGFFLGFLNEIKHGWKHGFGKISWFFILFSFGLLILGLQSVKATPIGAWVWEYPLKTLAASSPLSIPFLGSLFIGLFSVNVNRTISNFSYIID